MQSHPQARHHLETSSVNTFSFEGHDECERTSGWNDQVIRPFLVLHSAVPILDEGFILSGRSPPGMLRDRDPVTG
jgi:hypothetical protein